MKILFAGDTHGDFDHVRYLLATAVKQGADRVFVVGDFGAWEHVESGVEYLDSVSLEAEIVDVMVYFLDGNHDKTSLLLEYYDKSTDEEGFLVVRPRIRYARRGHRWTWQHTAFIALGGAYSTDKQQRLNKEARLARDAWEMARTLLPSSSTLEDFNPARETLWFPEEEMSDGDMEEILAVDSSHVDVMLTHDKPRSSAPRLGLKDIPECHPNQDRLQRAVNTLKPRLLIHGHLHHRYEDIIPNGNDTSTTVVGLDCNPSSSETGRVNDSWIVMDIIPSAPFPEGVE